jgi:hypothetical protein
VYKSRSLIQIYIQLTNVIDMKSFIKVQIWLLFLVFLLPCSSNEQSPININCSPYHFCTQAPNVTVKKDTIKSKVIELALYYENKKEYDKALKLYTEELKSEKSKFRKEAYEGIIRVELVVTTFNYKVSSFCSSKLEFIWHSILYVVLSFILILLLKYFLLLIHMYSKNSFSIIEVKPLKNYSQTLEQNIPFEIYIDYYIDKLSAYSELKKIINKNENRSTKPTVRTKEINTLFEFLVQSVAPKLGSFLNYFYNFIRPIDYSVSGYINFETDSGWLIMITLRKNRNILKIWEMNFEKSDLLLNMNRIAFEVLMITANKNQDE